MIFAVLMALQVVSTDSLPTVTLAEALNRGASLDPNYVRAIGQRNDAEWSRRAALSALVLPSITLSTDYQLYSRDIFNIGTSNLATTITTARADARYEIFAGGRKLAELSRSRAELEGTQANEVQAHFAAALLIESNYYDVLSGRELLDVARAQLQRSQEGLAAARARVVSGAAVQTDSLQFILDRDQARVNVLRVEASLQISRLQLGRRIGQPGGANAAALDTLPARELPYTLPQAVQLALEQGPAWKISRANERAAEASLRARKAAYIPSIVLSGNGTIFDATWPPSGLSRASFTVGVSWPIWDNFQRELGISRARSTHEVSRAVREDLERAAESDVTAAYTTYTTARAVLDISRTAVVVARENYRVQQTRYRAGATTILDLLEAQNRLTEAEAGVVRSQYAARLSVAGLEAILGRRLFSDKDQP
jgi:outer membrane protein